MKPLLKDTNCNNAINVICRWFVGLVFLFSSFVKGVDPMGTAFKIQEYMTAWSIGSITFEWALPFANFLAVALVTAEFLVGVMLITNAYRRLTAWLLAAMMLFFTATTLVDALTNKVTDCGCFGDAVKLTNWQTFWKNIVLDVPTVWIVLTCRNRMKRRFERDALVALFAIAAMVAFSLYNINNEPCIDFRAWKVGNQMISTEQNLKMECYISYRNNETGEVVELLSTECADYANDTLKWTYLDTRVVDPYEIHADGFAMLDMEGNDYAVDLIGSPDSLVIVTIHHLDKVSERGLESIRQMLSWAENEGIQLVMLTSALTEDMQAFLYEHNLDNVEFYFADATAIETMARSNPGFLLLKDGKVLGKWHYRNIEDLME